MHEVLIRYKNARSLRALKDLAKAFDMEIEKPADANKQAKNAPIRFSEKPDANALSGIWKDNPITIAELRKKAWGDRL